jgi:predicted permease
LRLWRHLLADLAIAVPREHWRALRTGHARGETLIEHGASWRGLGWDLRRGLSTLRRSPMVTCAVVATIAIGVGGSTLVWSLMAATFLRPPPYAEPERLAWIESFSEQDGRRMSSNLLDFRDWAAATRSYAGLAAYWSTTTIVSTGELPERLPTAFVTSPYFDVLRVQPLYGRAFELAEETPGQNRVAVLGYGLWQRLFGGDPGALGRTLRVDGVERTVVGVMPPGFPSAPSAEELWLPMAFPPDHWRANDRNTRWMDGAVGRLHDGVSFESADAELRTVARNLAARLPATNDGLGARALPLLEVEHAETRPALLALAVGVVLLLLLGCANVSSLLLARGTARRRDLALCTALGAARGRLVRQLLIEATLLATAGGAAGAVLARALLPATLAQAADRVPGLETAAIDRSALLVALLLSLASALIFGALPAWRLSGSLGGSLRESRHGVAAPRLRTLRMLTGLEVALASLLLCGALLLAQTFARLLRLDPGFDPRGVLALDVDLVPADYSTEAALTSYYERLLEALRALPGVEAAASTPYELPLGGSSWGIELGAVGQPLAARRADQLEARYGQITPDYFRVLRVPLRRGRAFTAADTAHAPPVAVLNETAARVVFGDEDPVGRRVWLWSPTDTVAEVVGVVGDLRVESLRRTAEPTVYVPWLQASHGMPSEQTVLLRVGGELEVVAALAGERARALDRHQPVGEPASLERLRVGSLGLERLSTTLASAFAGVALLLAGLGLHGVVSYAVAGRRHDIGVRLALGGRAGEVALETVGPTLLPVAFGLLLGLAGAVLSGRWLANRLFGVEPHDPPTLLAVVAVLAVVALAGAAAPFRRAVHVDPVESLRRD